MCPLLLWLSRVPSSRRHNLHRTYRTPDSNQTNVRGKKYTLKMNVDERRGRIEIKNAPSASSNQQKQQMETNLFYDEPSCAQSARQKLSSRGTDKRRLAALRSIFSKISIKPSNATDGRAKQHFLRPIFFAGSDGRICRRGTWKNFFPLAPRTGGPRVGVGRTQFSSGGGSESGNIASGSAAPGFFTGSSFFSSCCCEPFSISVFLLSMFRGYRCPATRIAFGTTPSIPSAVLRSVRVLIFSGPARAVGCDCLTATPSQRQQP